MIYDKTTELRKKCNIEITIENQSVVNSRLSTFTLFHRDFQMRNLKLSIFIKKRTSYPEKEVFLGQTQTG